jgi:hypothetical protein
MTASIGTPGILVARWFSVRMTTETTPVAWSQNLAVALSLAVFPGLVAVAATEVLARSRRHLPALALGFGSLLVAAWCYGPLVWNPRLRNGGGNLGEVLVGFTLAGVAYVTGVLIVTAAVGTWAANSKRPPNKAAAPDEHAQHHASQRAKISRARARR